MKLKFVLATSFFLGFNQLYGIIKFVVPPAVYAQSWKAFNASGDQIAADEFQVDARSGSTGYRYAQVPDETQCLVVLSEGYRWEQAGPVLDFQKSYNVCNLTPGVSYTLLIQDDQLVARQDQAPVAVISEIEAG